MLTSEDLFICSVCFVFESDINPDWFVTTPNGHVFHFNKCLKKGMDNGQEQCPMCDENLVVETLTRLNGIDPSSRRALNNHQDDSEDVAGRTHLTEEDNTLSIENLSISSAKPDYSFKINFLGDGGVGKSSLLYRYSTGVFHFSIQPTIGSDVIFKTVSVGGKIAKLSLWDTGGQERFKCINQNFVRNTHGVLLVYSYGEEETESLKSIKGWLDFIKRHGIPGAAMILVGNKVDTPVEQRTIKTEEGQELARSLGIPFFETSARDHYNVDATFKALVAEVLQRVETNQLEYMSPEKERESRITLREECQNEQEQRASEQSSSCSC